MQRSIKEPHSNFIEKLTALFSVTKEEALTEKSLDSRISVIVQDFLRAPKVSTDIEFERLAQDFTCSKIPLGACDVETYIDHLCQKIVSHSIHTSSPKFVGHMTSALPYFTRPLGNLMTAMNQNLVKTETSKAFTPYERQALAMIHRLIYKSPESFYNYHIQNSKSTLGMVLSGGTIANITALWCARNNLLGPTGEFAGIEYEGLPAALKFYNYEDVVVIGSSLMHYSFDKAADVLGIGRRNLLRVPTDTNDRIDLHELKRTISECAKAKRRVMAIIGIAGTTDCGAIDPLPQLAEIARSIGSHFHVDAAWGGPLLFSNIHRHKLDGIDQADSVTIDGHKQLYLPVGIGMVMLKDPMMANVIEKQAKYIVRAGSADLGKRSMEGSRPGMALFLHAALHLLGRKGYERLIDEGIRKTRHLVNSILSRPEFELLNRPEMNIVLYRYIPHRLRSKSSAFKLTVGENDSINRMNELLQKSQRSAGRSFVSRTTLSNRNRYAGMPLVALRMVIANPLTSDADLDDILDEQIRIALRLESRRDDAAPLTTHSYSRVQ